MGDLKPYVIKNFRDGVKDRLQYREVPAIRKHSEWPLLLCCFFFLNFYFSFITRMKATLQKLVSALCDGCVH